MKRRMKADILEGLPSKEEIKYPSPMPQDQAEAYRELVQEAGSNSERSRGFMLKALHECGAFLCILTILRHRRFQSGSVRNVRSTVRSAFDHRAAATRNCEPK